MVVIRLEENEKEKYMKNLLVATDILLKGIKNDDTIKRSEWNHEIYREVVRILENEIFPMLQFLQRTTNEQKYENNFGIYKEIVLSNGGLPEFFSYRQLLEDKTLADQRIKQVLDSEEVNSKEDLTKKWIDIANNGALSNKEEKRKYLLEIIPDKFQTIDFYEKIKEKEFFDIRDPMSKLSIRSLSGDKERYIISWFNYVTGFGVWYIYVAQLEEIDPGRKSLFDSIFKKDYIPPNGFFLEGDKGINIEPEFKKFLEDHMSSGAFFLAREMDKTFQTIYPERISSFQFGPMFIKGIGSSSLDFSWLFVENPDAYFLTAIREDIENGGRYKKVDAVDNIIGTKCIWRTNKLIEQRFGISSRDLEKSLKEYLKFPDMRFYLS